MAYSSKGRATGYTDFYKNNQNTPAARNNYSATNSTDSDVEMSAQDRKKAALKKRLQSLRKAGK